MKSILTAALALSLATAGAAMAQDEHRDDHRGGGGGEHHDGGGRGPGGGERHDGGGRPQGQPQGQRPGPPQAAQPAPRQDQHFDRGAAPGQGPGQRDPHFDQRQNGGGPGPGRGGPGAFRGRPNGFLAQHNWHPTQRFRGRPFYYPRGYGYQYWAFGSFLPPVYFAQDYALYDYWTYGLPAPPQGYRWVRVGPDALLIRYGDGYVLDAAYGLFY